LASAANAVVFPEPKNPPANINLTGVVAVSFIELPMHFPSFYNMPNFLILKPCWS
jgi:hypothetical protein